MAGRGMASCACSSRLLWRLAHPLQCSRPPVSRAGQRAFHVLVKLPRSLRQMQKVRAAENSLQSQAWRQAWESSLSLLQRQIQKCLRCIFLRCIFLIVQGTCFVGAVVAATLASDGVQAELRRLRERHADLSSQLAGEAASAQRVVSICFSL